jgi:alkanesulfonate monooxygenase SsuD/methylene tetrahydromethanopterin reductase-like flavin-dependent oxidoreductase (luciferase family)
VKSKAVGETAAAQPCAPMGKSETSIGRRPRSGAQLKVGAIHLCEPSSQRTPLIYQAGASSRGRQFAATHAECVFINGPSKQVIAPIVVDIRRRAAAAGRNPANSDFLDDDRDHRGDFRSRPSEARGLPILCQRGRRSGPDVRLDRPRFIEIRTREPILHSAQDAQTSVLEAFTTADPDRVWTVGEIAKHAAVVGR